jgi:hypothetical protein
LKSNARPHSHLEQEGPVIAAACGDDARAGRVEGDREDGICFF